MKKCIWFLYFMGIFTLTNAQIKVGFIGGEGSPASEAEKKQCFSSLSPFTDIAIVFLSNEDIRRKPSAHDKIDVLWIQRSDTGKFTPSETDPKFIKNLRSYIEGGGNLLLNQESFMYVNLLGLETKSPERRNKSCIDEGFGRRLGFHAFKDHPLFAGLNGGGYIQRPVTDTTVRITGFFGNDMPASGRVIAVDWDYIFLREESKMVVEYDLGKGKVIAVGGYMSFAMPNLNAAHLAQFTANAIRYLAGKSLDTPENYWYYGPYTVSECPTKNQDLDRLFAAIPAGSKWMLPQEKVQFANRTATSNFWDVAGERLVVMGKEKGGIEEIWTHPFMALRDYEVGINGSDSIAWLSNMTSEITISPSYICRTYKLPNGTLSEVIAASPDDPNAVVHYEFKGDVPVQITIQFRSNLRFMWPYSELATGTICHGWDADYNAFTLLDRTGDLAVMAGGNKVPVSHKSGQDRQDLMVNTTVTYNLDKEAQLDFVITGTSEGMNAAVNAFDKAIRDPQEILRSAAYHTSEIFNNSLIITTPNDTFNEGYLWALSGTDKFFVRTPGMGSSLVAGYSTTRSGWDGGHKVNGRPGYGWYFGRDGQWSGLALLDYGDFEKVREILRFYEKYQDLSGKIFHEATTSGVIHYDASDATPLYILLAGRYFRYSNDMAYLRQSWSHIRKAIDFCFSTDTDKDHLIENTNVGHGWVEGGELYGSHATLYLNACWAEALMEAVNMARSLKDADSNRFVAEYNEIMNIVNRDFWRASPAMGGPARDIGFYSYGKNKDGSWRQEITVLPAVAINFGLTQPTKAAAMLDHYAGNTFTTNWGVRIIGDDSPLFKPAGYHYGSVWPLFTGWTALAEYRYGYSASGFSHMMNNLNVYRNWGLGYVEEVLNGASYKPSGVCPHQCWSETMVLQPAIEGMLGIDVTASEPEVQISPQLPVNWDSIKIEHIRVGDRRLDMSFTRKGKNCVYQFSGTGGKITVDLAPYFPGGTVFGKASIDGKDVPLTVVTGPNHPGAVVTFVLEGSATVVIQAEWGIGVLPVIANPLPGDPADGLRVISEKFSGKTYSVDLEGPAGTTGDFRLRMLNHTRISKLVNSDIFQMDKENFLLRVNFKDNGQPYVRRTVMMETVR